MKDEVMLIVDSLPISSQEFGNPSSIRKKGKNHLEDQSQHWKKELEDQNQRIDNLKSKIKTLTNVGGSPEQLHLLQQELDKEFKMLDELLKKKLESHSKSMNPTNIIHLATTTEEDNLPPIMLYASQNSSHGTVTQDNSKAPLRRIPSHEYHNNQHRTAEEKFQKIQKKLIDLCCNDIRKGLSDKDGHTNLNDDIKKQFDILYSELRVLEKELFLDDSPDFDSFENSEKKIAFETLKQQNAMLLEQGEQFKVLFKEQQLEIENYRKKYMQTLQNVMEQHMRITSMENLSKTTEKKTCQEITRIKNNLRKKLDHLAPMSDMLENCNKKLIYTVKRKTEMEQNYEDLCNELRQLKKQLACSDGGAYKAKCELLAGELKKSKELNEFNNKRINQMQLQLQQAKAELERVKLKSSKIIKSTMNKCDFLKSELNSRINQLEIELAQARAITSTNSK